MKQKNPQARLRKPPTLRQYAAWILLGALATPAWAVQAPARLAAAFGAPPQLADLTLSPNGQLLAWLQHGPSGREVIVYAIVTHAVLRIEPIGRKLTVASLKWAGNSALLIDARETERLPHGYRSRWNQPFLFDRCVALDIANGKTHILLGKWLDGARLREIGNTAPLLDWDIPQRPHTVIMSTPARYTSGFWHSRIVDELFAVDTRTGKSKPIAHGDRHTAGWLVNDSGHPVARSEWRSHRDTIYTRRAGKWRRLYRGPEGTSLRLLALDTNGHAILASMRARGARARVWRIPLDGSAPSPMLPAITQGVVGVVFSRYSKKPIQVEIGGFPPRWRWIDTAAQARYESVAAAFPEPTVWVYDPTENGGEGLAEVQGVRHPPVYYFINFVTHRASIIGDAYPQLKPAALVRAHWIQYRLHDGQTIHAQVFLPPGGGKDLPLVVFAPGDLAGAGQRFDWFAQYLAASGYAVLRPEIRKTVLKTEGGPIYWGGASQRYAVDGVRVLVREGLADPHRVCIVGSGYGGYAALAGAAFFPNTYACAASIDGFADLPSLLGTEITEFEGRKSDHAVSADWRTHVGSRLDPKVAAESPLHAAQAVVARVLLIHDQKDTVVPFGQSAEMARALKKLGKPVTFIKLKGDDHYLTRAHARIEVLKAVGTFLRRALSPARRPTSASKSRPSSP